MEWKPTEGVNEPDVTKPDRWTSLPVYDDEYKARCVVVEHKTYDWQQIFADYRFQPVTAEWKMLNREFGLTLAFTDDFVVDNLEGSHPYIRGVTNTRGGDTVVLTCLEKPTKVDTKYVWHHAAPSIRYGDIRITAEFRRYKRPRTDDCEARELLVMAKQQTGRFNDLAATVIANDRTFHVTIDRNGPIQPMTEETMKFLPNANIDEINRLRALNQRLHIGKALKNDFVMLTAYFGATDIDIQLFYKLLNTLGSMTIDES